jgi:phage tail-like protein
MTQGNARDEEQYGNHDAYANCRFYVIIDKIPQAVFTELSGLQMETEVLEYTEGGNNSYTHRLPGRTKVSNITLKRGMARNNELFKWYLENQQKITRRGVSVVMYDTQGKELMQWAFVGAYPVKWVGPQFTAGGNQTAVETLELAHGGLDLGKTK